MQDTTQPTFSLFQYLPRLTSPLGLILYTFFSFIVISLIRKLKHQYIFPKLQQNFDQGIKSTILKNRIKRSQEAQQLLKKLS